MSSKKMRSLAYHDIIEDPGSSGFQGCGANVYKLTPTLFKAHLHAIRETVETPPVVIDKPLNGGLSKEPWSITFDDGGKGAYFYAADLLEEFGWRGHFFITTNHIGKNGFLSREQIKELDRRGHVIGSHSCSHPNRMTSMSMDELLKEWRNSIKVLSDILGEKVNVASVPCGFYSDRVGESAAEAGIEFLFTSEPVRKIKHLNGSMVVGRYCLRNNDGPDDAASLASGKKWHCFKWWFFHNVKKLPKLMGDERYEKVRRVIMKNGG